MGPLLPLLGALWVAAPGPGGLALAAAVGVPPSPAAGAGERARAGAGAAGAGAAGAGGAASARGVGARAPWSAPSDAAIDALIGEHTRDPIPERLRALTAPLVGAPYLLSPLGEGHPGERDPDPRMRLDAFDCTTFVETSVALARTGSVAGLTRVLDRLRYRGPPTFEARRHLPELTWIPDLVAAGELEDVTAAIGGRHTVTSTFTMTPQRWKRRSVARTLDLGVVPEGAVALRWIPIEALPALDIPPGTIVSVVREDVPWAPTRITHQGVALRDPVTGAVFVRHASPVAKRVIDEPVARLVNRYLHPKIERKWRPVGVNLLRVRE